MCKGISRGVDSAVGDSIQVIIAGIRLISVTFNILDCVLGLVYVPFCLCTAYV